MKFYRYDLRQDPSYPNAFVARLSLSTYYLVKETPKGYWIDINKLVDWMPDYRLEDLRVYCKWVSKTSTKRWAYPTKKEALESLLARSRRRLQYVERNYGIVTTGINLVKEALLQEQ